MISMIMLQGPVGVSVLQGGAPPASAAAAPHLTRLAPQPSCACLRRAAAPVSGVRPALPSLVPETLREMEQDTELQAQLAALQQQGQAALTRQEKLQRQRSLDKLQLPGFVATCKAAGAAPLVRARTRVLQLNIGLYCNQACTHCHVESSPKRTEMMDK